MHWLTRQVVKILTTCCYVGYLPAVPGTFGTLAGLAVYYSVRNSPALHMLAALAATLATFFLGGAAEKIFAKKDPKQVVLDEVAGMLLSLLFLPYTSIPVITAAFILFRGFDAFKIYPINRLQNLKGGLGIMADDLLAAVYTNLLLQAVLRLTCLYGS